MACANINDEEDLVGIFNNLNVNPMAIISQSQKGHPFWQNWSLHIKQPLKHNCWKIW